MNPSESRTAVQLTFDEANVLQASLRHMEAQTRHIGKRDAIQKIRRLRRRICEAMKATIITKETPCDS
jgi:hypothetical protein